MARNGRRGRSSSTLTYHVQRLIHDEHIDSSEITVSGTTELEFVEPSTVSFTRVHLVAFWAEKIARA